MTMTAVGQNIMQCLGGTATFTSNAPLEVIQAESNQLKGVLDKSSKTFAFTVDMQSFEGFNSPLQQTHFNENYMESQKFPMATFKGKIIENIDFDTPGTYKARAKGKLTIHGVEHERIIRSDIIIDEQGSILISSEFTILLKDHEIRIPKIVYQKIAEIILVRVTLILDPKES
jgi:polyisoprenoid-binding protein YceI